MQLLINNRQLDFGGTIRMVENNTMFGEYNTFSYPFDLHLTANNQHILDYPSIPENVAKSFNYDCVLKYGHNIRQGKLIIKQVYGTRVKCYFAGNRDIVNQLKSLVLNDVTIGAIDMTAGVVKDWFAWAPIYNENFSDNLEFHAPSNFINGGTNRSDCDFMSTPYPKLMSIIDAIFKHLNIECCNYVKNMPGYSDIYMHHNKLMSYLFITGTLWVHYEPGGFDEDSDAHHRQPITNMIVNASNELVITLGQVVWSSTWNRYDIRFLKLRDLGIERYADKVVAVQYIGNKMFRLINCVYTGAIVADMYTSAFAYFTYYDIIAISNKWKFFNSSAKAFNFINEVAQFLGLAIIYKNDTVTIMRWNDVLTDPSYNDITNKLSSVRNIQAEDYDGLVITAELDDNDLLSASSFASVNASKVKDAVSNFTLLPMDDERYTIRLCKESDEYYILNPHGWELLSSALNKVISHGTADLEVDFKVYGLPQANKNLRHALTNENYDINVCCVNQPYFYPHEANIDDCSVRLFLLRYDQSSDNVADHHYFTESLNDEFSLRLNGDTGLYNRNLKQYYDWQVHHAKNATMSIAWSADDINRIDFTKKVKINSSLYLVKSISFEIDQSDAVVVGDTELVKL